MEKLFRRLLIEMEEPAVDRKVGTEKWEHHEFNRRLVDDHKTSGSQFRYAT